MNFGTANFQIAKNDHSDWLKNLAYKTILLAALKPVKRAAIVHEHQLWIKNIDLAISHNWSLIYEP